jgi:hypothetical protein
LTRRIWLAGSSTRGLYGSLGYEETTVQMRKEL